MIFNSLSFLIFFIVVTFLYYVVSFRWRWSLLLIASCIFYMAFIPQYILILAALITIDYFTGIGLEKITEKKRKYLLILSIISNLGILFSFKYFNFFQTNIATISHFIHWNYSPRLLELLLPIGLSFHTFQSLSYVIEVYKKKYKAEHHFGLYALYVMFYPQLVAGPIERPQELLAQLHKNHPFNELNISEGLRRMLFGLFKKIIIADRLSILVTQVYGHPHEYIGFPLLLATVSFAFQVYCDFSGYCDIAIGASKVMGFTLRENFNAPYLATSITDFWRRWHMSLYSWFRDYLYIPLGGNRKGIFTQMRNIGIVFLTTGLWHGANWTYIFWGAIHGIYMIASLIVSTYIKPLVNMSLSPPVKFMMKLFGSSFTFALVCFAWIFFRASTIADGIYIATHLSIGLGTLVRYVVAGKIDLFMAIAFLQNGGVGLTLPQIGIAAVAILFMAYIEYIERTITFIRLSVWNRWIIYMLLALVVLNLGTIEQVPFIYFQF